MFLIIRNHPYQYSKESNKGEKGEVVVYRCLPPFLPRIQPCRGLTQELWRWPKSETDLPGNALVVEFETREISRLWRMRRDWDISHMFLMDETNSFFIEFAYSCYTNEIALSSYLDKDNSLELLEGGWVLHLSFRGWIDVSQQHF